MADKETATDPIATDPIMSVPTATDVTPDQPSLMEVELHTEFRTNSIIYGKGATEDSPVTVSVEPDIAQDLLRRQAEYDQVEKDKNKIHIVTHNAGSIDAGK